MKEWELGVMSAGNSHVLTVTALIVITAHVWIDHGCGPRVGWAFTVQLEEVEASSYGWTGRPVQQAPATGEGIH